MATIRALFFARYRDLLGTDVLEVPVEDSVSLDTFVRDLRERGAPYDLLPERPAVAVNREVARGDVRLRGGDEVAFLPPVAGG